VHLSILVVPLLAVCVGVRHDLALAHKNVRAWSGGCGSGGGECGGPCTVSRHRYQVCVCVCVSKHRYQVCARVSCICQFWLSPCWPCVWACAMTLHLHKKTCVRGAEDAIVEVASVADPAPFLDTDIRCVCACVFLDTDIRCVCACVVHLSVLVVPLLAVRAGVRHDLALAHKNVRAWSGGCGSGGGECGGPCTVSRHRYQVCVCACVFLDTDIRCVCACRAFVNFGCTPVGRAYECMRHDLVLAHAKASLYLYLSCQIDETDWLFMPYKLDSLTFCSCPIQRQVNAKCTAGPKLWQQCL